MALLESSRIRAREREGSQRCRAGKFPSRTIPPEFVGMAKFPQFSRKLRSCKSFVHHGNPCKSLRCPSMAWKRWRRRRSVRTTTRRCPQCDPRRRVARASNGRVLLPRNGVLESHVTRIAVCTCSLKSRKRQKMYGALLMGTIGDIGAYSLQINKLITVGEGCP